MILATNLVSTIQRMLYEIRKISLLPVAFPFPYSWDANLQQFYLTPGFCSWWWIVPYTTFLLGSLSQFVVKIVYGNNRPLAERIQRLYFILAYIIMANSFVGFHKFQFKSVCRYFSQLVQFERRHINTPPNQRWNNLESKMISVLATLFEISMRLLDVLMPLVSAILPDSPWNVFAAPYVLLAEYVPQHPNFDYLLKITMYLSNYIYWRLMMDFIVMSYVVNFMVGVYALKCCLSLFQYLTAFVNPENLKIYRELQMLTNLYNITHRSSCMVGIVLLSIMACITYTFSWVGNFRELHPANTITSMVLANAVSTQILVVFRISADVFKTSCHVHKQIRGQLANGRCGNGKWLRKFWKSCPLLKVEFFGNYFDRTTPLVILQFCVNQTVSLILLKQ